jgi:hypothetical protein
MNEKPRLLEITDHAELRALHDRNGPPYVFSSRDLSGIRFWANAEDLRAWRLTKYGDHLRG